MTKRLTVEWRYSSTHS